MKVRRAYRHTHLLCLSFLFPAYTSAHEFWIEPTHFEISTTEKLVANLNVGQHFKGNPQSFIPDKFVELSITDSRGNRAVSGRLGELPAVNVPVQRAGLHILTYQSRPQSAVYEDFAKFERFATKEGNAWVLDEHKRRGLSRRNVTEAYTRYAKALVQVGDAAGADRIMGMPLELVLETNPYADSTGEDVAVTLLWQGKGLASAQISVFRKYGGCDATRSTVATDDNGRALVPRSDGGRFLLNAVHVIEPTPRTLEDINAVWESLWASTTFELPATAAGESDTGECPAATDGQDK